MAEVKSNELYQDKILSPLRDELKLTNPLLEKYNDNLREMAKLSNEVIKTNSKLSNAKEIRETEQAIRLSNIQYKEAVKTEDQLRKAREKQRLEEIKLQQDREKAFDNFERQEARRKKIEKDQADRYKIMSAEARELKNESKRLGAELDHLTMSGKKDGAEFRLLEKQYRETTAQAVVMDRKLKDLDSRVGDNFRTVGNYSTGVSKLRNDFRTLGSALGIGVAISYLKDFGVESVNAFRESEKALSQVRAGLESTNNAAGFTLDQLTEKANNFAKNTLFDDDEILKDVTAQILTFTNISGEAFDGAQQAVLDLATRLGGDLQGASIQVGKALNDPIKGITALRRVGVSFTEEQQKQIETLVKSGEVQQAQALILKELNGEFGGSAKAAAEADGGFTQLSHTIEEAKEQFGKVLVEGLKPTIASLKEFFASITEQDIRDFISLLGSIGKTLLQVVAAYTTYRVTLVAVRTVQALSNAEIRKSIFNFNDLGKATDDATGSQNKFAGALRGIAWTTAISLGIELANTFYKILTNTELAEQKLASYNKAIQKGQDSGMKGNAKIEKFETEQRKRLDDNLKAGKISQAQYNKGIADLEKGIDKIRKQEIQQLNERKNAARINIGNLQNQQNQVNKFLNPDKWYELEVAIAKQKEEIAGTNEIIKSLKGSTDQLTLSQDANTVSTGSNTKAVKENKDSVTEAEKAYKKWLETRRDLSKVEDVERNLISGDDIDKAEEAIRARRRAAAEIRVIEAELSGDQEKIREARIEQILEEARLAEEAALGNAVEIQRINLEAQKRIFEIQQEGIDEARKLEEEALKKRRETIGEFFDWQIDRMNKASQKRISQLDEEISAAQKQQEYFAKLAEQGNISAEQSLAEQQRIINEANRKKQNEEEAIKRREAIKQAREIYSKNLEKTGDPIKALTATVVDVAALEALLNTIPAFIEGTDTTVANALGKPNLPGKDGYIIRADGSEKILNPAMSAMTGDMTTGEIADVAFKHRTGQLIHINSAKQDHAGTSFDIAPMIQEMREMKEAVKSIPVIEHGSGNVTRDFYEWVERENRGNKNYTRTHRKYRS